MRGGSLRRHASQAIPPITEARQRPARRRLSGEEIVGKREVLQPGKLTYGVGNLPGEHVVRHIQLLQTDHVPDLPGQRSHQLIVADVKHRHIRQTPNLRRQARPQPVFHENNLVQGPRHVA